MEGNMNEIKLTKEQEVYLNETFRDKIIPIYNRGDISSFTSVLAALASWLCDYDIPYSCVFDVAYDYCSGGHNKW